jgi:hypothetical protein
LHLYTGPIQKIRHGRNGILSRRKSWETHWSGWRRKWEDVNEGVGVEFEVLFDGVFDRSAREG